MIGWVQLAVDYRETPVEESIEEGGG